MPNVKVITDSACDLPEETVAALDIGVVPLSIRFGDEEFVDRKDLSPADFWRRCKASPKLPETAAPSPGSFQAAFQEAKDEGRPGVVCITLSSKLSATYQSAITAARDFGDDFAVRVVDSELITMAQGIVVTEAATLAAEGNSVDEVEAAARSNIPRITAMGTLDTLENLRKGGRIGGAQALLGSVLSVKPVVKLVNGEVQPESKARTRSRALAHLVESVKAVGIMDRVAVTHGDAGDIDAFIKMTEEAFPGVDIVVSQVGAVLGTHVGEGAVCLLARLK